MGKIRLTERNDDIGGRSLAQLCQYCGHDLAAIKDGNAYSPFSLWGLAA